jgi:hypothetical protein
VSHVNADARRSELPPASLDCPGVVTSLASVHNACHQHVHLIVAQRRNGRQAVTVARLARWLGSLDGDRSQRRAILQLAALVAAIAREQKGDWSDEIVTDTQKGCDPMDQNERNLRRAEAVARRARYEVILRDLESPDERVRALAVRALCPCEFDWPRSAWEHIFAACEDLSPRVRLEALHVLEDAPTPPDPRLMRALRQARSDPDPRVADAAHRYIKERHERERRRRQGRYETPEEYKRNRQRQVAGLVEEGL